MKPKILSYAFLITWVAASVRLTAPLLLAALGETFGELSGMINIGIEGLMLIGALAAYLVSYYSGQLWLAVVSAVVIAEAVALLLALLYLGAGVNQIVGGLIFNLLAVGLTSYAYRAFIGTQITLQRAPLFAPVSVPGLSRIPFLGRALFTHNLLVYITFALVFVSGFVLYRTRFGLKLRAAGEHRLAAAASGINVVRIRYIGFLISGGAAGLAGAFLMLTQIGLFRDNIVAGRGFIALSIVIFGRWNPYKAALAALVFGAADALQLSLQVLGFPIPPQLLLSMPYVLTIIAMSGLLGRAQAPGGFTELIS